MADLNINLNGVLTDAQLRASRVPMQSADQFGFVADSTPNGQLLTTNKVRLVGEIIDGDTIDTNFWTPSGTVGTATEVASELVLTSGTADTNNARIFTVQRANWISGTSNKFRAQMRIASSDNNVTMRCGVGWGGTMPTVTDGAYFKIIGSTISVNTMFATVETSVASGSFNGTYAAPTLTNNNVFEILYTLGRVYFLINNVIVHTASFQTQGWTSGTTNFHAFADVVNTGVSAAIPYTFRMMNISRLGDPESIPTYKHIDGAATTVCKRGAGSIHILVVNSAGTLCTIYDNTAGSGAVIGIIDTTKAGGTTGSIDYHCPFYNGLTLVTTGAGTDLTVIYE